MVVEETIEMVRVILEAATAGPLSSLDWRWKEEKSHSENLHDFISVVIVELDDLDPHLAWEPFSSSFSS